MSDENKQGLGFAQDEGGRRLVAALADRYRVERQLGAGGMATVYLAHDLKHDRDVAIKVLHPDLGAALGGERFLSEIRTTARLQHPHILPLLDSGEADGLLYYVMPVVTGETLRARLEREKQLPIPEAVRIAREVASALDYAHRQGVIHRDVKPENVLLHDGSALVADFGIALAVQSAGGQRMTQTGLSLGTPQYMSPEQAMGERAIDARSDVYALGAITYEMLTGEPPFTGATVQAIVAKVLSAEPERPSLMRKTIPPHVEGAVQVALAKLPADRFATAAEFAAALVHEGGPGHSMRMATGSASAAMSNVGRQRALVVAGVTIAALAAAGGWLAGRAPGSATGAEAAVNRFDVVPEAARFAYPTGGVVAGLAISPDGQWITAVVARPSGGTVLAVRQLSQLSWRVLSGTEGGSLPAFSPDGRWLAFLVADGALKKIMLDGTSLTTILAKGPEVTGANGITWLSDREIVLAAIGRQGSSGAVLKKVPASGGAATPFSRLDSTSQEIVQLAPMAVDGGRLVFYTSSQGMASSLGIGVIRAADGNAHLLKGVQCVRVLGWQDGILTCVRGDGALMAIPVDARTLAVGAPVQLNEEVALERWVAGAAVSASGTLFYQRAGGAGQLVRVDERGAATPLMDSLRPYLHPKFSPDGRRVALEVRTAAGADIWITDLVSHTFERLTREGSNDRPEWSPDGERILFSAAGGRGAALWSRPADGRTPARKELEGKAGIREGVYTPDGRAIVYRVDSTFDNRDIWMAPTAGDRTPVPLLTGPNDEKQPRVSPDGRWLAYTSNESGREEVYVRPLAAEGGRVPVSAGGGSEAVWSRDGKRLFYREGERLMAATITTSPAAAVSARQALFEGPFATDPYHPNYDVAPDGKSFVMVRQTEESRRMVIVVNWTAEVRKRMEHAK